MLARTFLTVWTGLLGLWISAAGVCAGQERVRPAVAELIARLDHDNYFVRERATEQLALEDENAVPALANAAEGPSLEASCRSIHVLRELSVAEREETANAAIAALENLAKSPGTVVSAAAESALMYHSVERSRRALAELIRLGAVLTNHDPNFSGERTRLSFGRNYTGGDDGLSQLRWILTPNVVSFRGATLGEKAISHLKRLQKVERLELYGTGISQAEALALRDVLPKTEVEWRAGGFLGISGQPGLNGCMISLVQPDSAAEAAGMEPGDVIVRFAGVAVTGFEDLTAEISKRQGGEKVPVLVRREERELNLEVTLGSWE